MADGALVVIVFLLFCLPDLMFSTVPHGAEVAVTHLPPAGTLALQAGLVLPLGWWRRAPAPAFAVIMATFLVQWSLLVWLRADIAVFIALYGLALRGRGRHLLWARRQGGRAGQAVVSRERRDRGPVATGRRHALSSGAVYGRLVRLRAGGEHHLSIPDGRGVGPGDSDGTPTNARGQVIRMMIAGNSGRAAEAQAARLLPTPPSRAGAPAVSDRRP
jgi:hypothetical protein